MVRAKPKLLRIGIVGCGAIGSSLAKAIAKGFCGKVKLSGVFDIDNKRALHLSKLIVKNASLAAKSQAQLVDKSGLIIEAASSLVSAAIARSALNKGRDIMIMSVGGILDEFTRLSRLAEKRNAKIYIPSGAICGIDALKAARMAKVKKVILTTTKHPLSFKGVKFIEGKGIDLSSARRELTLFSGSAEEAVKYFPQNINVAAVLSLAGIGWRKTKVKIVASPKVRANIHEIQIESSAGKIFTRTENILHPENPKTSYLAVLSAVAMLKQISEPVRIGT